MFGRKNKLEEQVFAAKTLHLKAMERFLKCTQENEEAIAVKDEQIEVLKQEIGQIKQDKENQKYLNVPECPVPFICNECAKKGFKQKNFKAFKQSYKVSPGNLVYYYTVHICTDCLKK